MAVKFPKKPAALAAEVAFADALARAKSSRTRLSFATDNLNKQLTAAERAIAELKLGVMGMVTIDAPPEEEFERYLLFTKISDQWRLATAYGRGIPDEDLRDITPLVNASRAIRLMAVGHLRQLVQQMAGAIDLEIEQVETSAKSVAGFVESLIEDDMGGPPPADDVGPPPPGDDDAPF